MNDPAAPTAGHAEAPLDRQVAVVTGGGRGIGRAIALTLSGLGHRVCVAARTDTEIDDTMRQIHATGGDAMAVATDVTDYGSCVDLVSEVVRSWGEPPTILINNAGGGDTANLLVESDPDAWGATLTQNLLGTYHMCHATLPGMIERRHGRIVNVGSGAGYTTVRGTSGYGAAKAGVAHLSRILAAEVWKHGVEVNEVIPGPVATRLTQGIFAEGETPKIAPSERVKPPQEVAKLVSWLVQQPPGGPTGQMFSLARRSLV